MKRKIVSLLLSLALITGVLAGCGGSGGSDANTASSSGDGLKIAIVTSLSGVDDGSFNQDNYNGIQDFIKDHEGAQVTPVLEKTGDPAACIKAVEEIVADYDVIVCDGFQFAGIVTVAEDNPDKYFLLVDTFPADAEGNAVEVENINAMTYKEGEGGFLAGLAAALSSQTKKVAIVNGIAYPTNVSYQYGFMSGVNYANKHYNTGVEIVELPSYAGTDVTGAKVGGNYVGSFSDEANGKIVGEALIKKGCDVIYVAAGASGNGVFTAVKESKAKDFVIGCDTDQYDLGVNGNENIVLTSALKCMRMNDKRVLESIADGSFKGGNYLLGVDTDSVSYVSEEGRCQIDAGTKEKIDKAYQLIKDGKIIPADSSNGMTPDNFTGIDAE